ncbi:S-methyl-5'-thioadenosine phosphorylase [Candidatus Woesearchaeota archaeon]|nr:S-methyl-5'-thioadenosine phosphorylase [Candidatus Woesearchaeota archaeon]
MKIGIIGGSGLEDPKILKDAKDIIVKTHFGNPSSPLALGKINGIDVVILSRHGRKHELMPTNVPNQANIHALKEQGCTHIIATSACGSLREDIKPGDFVLADQFIDMTTKRKSTFYEKDHVCHIAMAEPFCKGLRNRLFEAGNKLGYAMHEKGTVVTVEGPRFSTRAESHLWRLMKADIINMSTVPECVLAREAGLCYAVVCMATDYDCFLEGREVNIGEVMAVFKKNAERVKKLLCEVIPAIKFNPECRCRTDIRGAVIS